MGKGYMLVFVSVWEEEVEEVEDKVWWGRIKEGDGSVFKWALFLGLYFYLSSLKPSERLGQDSSSSSEKMHKTMNKTPPFQTRQTLQIYINLKLIVSLRS